MSNTNGNNRPVRVWCDGCYDMVHFGHANSLRQAKALGDYLVVGVHSDEEIRKHKGPPVFTSQERYKMMRGIKWVDQVVENAPYVTTLDTLDAYNCDFCVHGDDITTTADGKDTYHQVKSANRYKEVKRTVGVSTTNLVDRMLKMTSKSNGAAEGTSNSKKAAKGTSKSKRTAEGRSKPKRTVEGRSKSPATGTSHSKTTTDKGTSHFKWTAECTAPITWVAEGTLHFNETRSMKNSSKFVMTTQKILQFGNGRTPKPTDRIVYVDGAFDLFHPGHLDFLERAKELGEYLIVGVHSDHLIASYKRHGYPVMTLDERVLTVLAYKVVDEVVIGAPYTITADLLSELNIHVVCKGLASCAKGLRLPDEFGRDPYAEPKKQGKFRMIDSGNCTTTEMIVERIVFHRLEYERRNSEKVIKENKINEQMQETRRKSKNKNTKSSQSPASLSNQSLDPTVVICDVITKV